jgi:hypothetical protein
MPDLVSLNLEIKDQEEIWTIHFHYLCNFINMELRSRAMLSAYIQGWGGTFDQLPTFVSGNMTLGI